MAKNLKATTLGVTIPVDMAQAVYQQVREGHYTSASDVVRAALQLLLKLDETGLSEGAAPENVSKRRLGGTRQRPQ